MNKKGNLPTIILVIGILVVCSLALLSFYYSNFKIQNSFANVKLVEELNSQIDKNLFEGKPIEGLYLDKKSRVSFKPFSLKKKIIFSVLYEPLG